MSNHFLGDQNHYFDIADVEDLFDCVYYMVKEKLPDQYMIYASRTTYDDAIDRKLGHVYHNERYAGYFYLSRISNNSVHCLIWNAKTHDHNHAGYHSLNEPDLVTMISGAFMEAAIANEEFAR